MKLVTDGISATQQYLRSGKTLEDFEREHGICGKSDGHHLILDYSQLTARDSEPYAWVCRGLILDPVTYEVIAMGLHRFKNWGEHYAAELDWTTAVAFEKLDGTMVNRWWSPHTSRFEYSTRFQLPADLERNTTPDTCMTWRQLIDLAVQSINLSEQPRDETWTLEVCSRHNKVVVSYDRPFAAILAVRNICTLKESVVVSNAPKSYRFTSAQEVKDFADTFAASQQEGFVVRDAAFNKIKIKSTDYVNLHRLKDGITGPKAIINIAKGNDYDEIVVHFPEYKAILDGTAQLIAQEISQHEEVYGKLSHIKDMKTFALELKKYNLSCPSALFSLHRGKTKCITDGFNALLESSYHAIFEDRVRGFLAPKEYNENSSAI